MAVDADRAMLDNPVWHALNTRQAHMAIGGARARRFPPDAARFAALESLETDAWADLAAIAEGGALVARVGDFEPPAGWTTLMALPGLQMILESPVPEIALPSDHRPLAASDVPAMLALVALTQPGPFGQRTIEFGGYTGIFEGDRLVAMAGRRLAVPGYVEISAVCTHPDVQRRGYAAALTTHVAKEIARDGDTPMLHVKFDNFNAQRVYAALGFVTRAEMTFKYLTPPSSPQPSDLPAAGAR